MATASSKRTRLAGQTAAVLAVFEPEDADSMGVRRDAFGIGAASRGLDAILDAQHTRVVTRGRTRVLGDRFEVNPKSARVATDARPRTSIIELESPGSRRYLWPVEPVRTGRPDTRRRSPPWS